jgi:hypothetical protein
MIVSFAILPFVILLALLGLEKLEATLLPGQPTARESAVDRTRQADQRPGST